MQMQHVVHEAFYPLSVGPLPSEVGELATPKFFMKGNIIIRQGELARHFFYVHSGHVRATIVRPDGTEKVFAFAEPGQFFADVPFFQKSKHWYTGLAVESTHVSVFSKEVMEEINRVRPDFVLTLMQSLAHKVWMLSNQLMTITFDPSEVRLARILIELLTRKPDGTRSLGITHQELSSLAGTSRVMVTRVLNGLQARGIVDLGKGSLCVKDFSALERIAAFEID